MNKELKTKKLVTVYNSANNSLVEISIPTEVTKREELENYLEKENISFLNTTMLIAESDLVLATKNSSIPDDDFTLVLTPKKVKSGSDLDLLNASYAEMKSFIKEETQKNKEKVREHFGNYTQLSKEKMRELLTSYIANITPVVSHICPESNNSIIVKIRKLLSKFIDEIDEIISFSQSDKKEQNKIKEEKLNKLKEKYAEIKLDI